MTKKLIVSVIFALEESVENYKTLVCNNSDECNEHDPATPVCLNVTVGAETYNHCVAKRADGETCANTVDCNNDLACHDTTGGNVLLCKQSNDLACDNDDNRCSPYNNNELFGTVLDVCIGGKCSEKSNLDGPCEEDFDCVAGYSCAGAVCKANDDTVCTANNNCASPNSVCHTKPNAEQLCRPKDNLQCDANNQCGGYANQSVCREGKCQGLGTEGQLCDISDLHADCGQRLMKTLCLPSRNSAKCDLPG